MTEMTEQELALLAEHAGDNQPRLCVKAKRGIDAGKWWRRTPVWLCVMADELVMFAVSRRRYIASLPLSDCSESYYSPASGELIVEPEEQLEISRFAMSAKDALSVLKYLKV
jgi:hypothetical protein